MEGKALPVARGEEIGARPIAVDEDAEPDIRGADGEAGRFARVQRLDEELAELIGAEAGFQVRLANRTISLTLRGENLTDRLYRDATSRIKDFAPNPGRNVSVLLRAAL